MLDGQSRLSKDLDVTKGEGSTLAQIRDIARITKHRPRPNKESPDRNRGHKLQIEDEKPNLTDEQLDIVELPPESRLLVTAGPGTGKTHVLIARLVSLVNRYHLQPGREILVLSFSRAAVGEIRRRVRKAGGDVRYVRTYTFDSFATRLLSQVDPTGDWIDEDYNGRIGRAVAAVRERPEAQRLVADYAHILVDEIQDLVDVRAELLLALLEAASGGFTLLGDPAQGIYNFQLEEPELRRVGSRLLYAHLTSRYKGKLREYELTKNYRVQTELARIALGAGAKLNRERPDYAQIADELNTVAAGLPALGNLEKALPPLLSDGRNTAILCRTNAQALLISRELAQANIAHGYQRAATDRVISPWVGIVLGTWDYGQIGKSAFIERFLQKIDAPPVEPEQAWSMLKGIEGQQGNNLDITTVSARIAVGYIPDELNLNSSCQLTVSTIHRAKGLEFDRVIIVDPHIDLNKGNIELSEETRLLYVALTRPRRDLFKMAPPDTRNMMRLGYDERWARRVNNWCLLSVEIKGQDIHSRDPAGGYPLGSGNPVEIQEYLRQEVKIGDPVLLNRVSNSSAGHPRAFYAVEHNHRPIGITSERFADILHSIIKVNKGWKVQWPSAILETRVEAIDTVAGTVVSGHNAGLNGTGLWLRARVAGLGRIKWK